jgi:hypothetical protein
MSNLKVNIIEEYLFTQCNMIKQYYMKYPKKLKDTKNYAVIVEPRSNHKLLESVCMNVMYYLPEDWNLVVYSYDMNIVRETLTNIDFIFCKTEKPSFTLDEYSHLLMSKDFWSSIPGDNIIIFQTDSYITRKFEKDYINQIIQYPFVGAIYRIVDNKMNCQCCPGYRACNRNIISINRERNFSMNGGFSFRNKQAMIECIEKISISDIVEYRFLNKLPINQNTLHYEDTNFEDALFLINREFPSYRQCLEFCSQTIYEVINSYAVHGINRNYVYDNLIYHLRPSLIELHYEISRKINENGNESLRVSEMI